MFSNDWWQWSNKSNFLACYRWGHCHKTSKNWFFGDLTHLKEFRAGVGKMADLFSFMAPTQVCFAIGWSITDHWSSSQSQSAWYYHWLIAGGYGWRPEWALSFPHRGLSHSSPRWPWLWSLRWQCDDDGSNDEIDDCWHRSISVTSGPAVYNMMIMGGMSFQIDNPEQRSQLWPGSVQPGRNEGQCWVQVGI